MPAMTPPPMPSSLPVGMGDEGDGVAEGADFPVAFGGDFAERSVGVDGYGVADGFEHGQVGG